jgi:hypothetical protein
VINLLTKKNPTDEIFSKRMRLRSKKMMLTLIPFGWMHFLCFWINDAVYGSFANNTPSGAVYEDGNRLNFQSAFASDGSNFIAGSYDVASDGKSQQDWKLEPLGFCLLQMKGKKFCWKLCILCSSIL